jgi:hypothetical protein
MLFIWTVKKATKAVAFLISSSYNNDKKYMMKMFGGTIDV